MKGINYCRKKMGAIKQISFIPKYTSLLVAHAQIDKIVLKYITIPIKAIK